MKYVSNTQITNYFYSKIMVLSLSVKKTVRYFKSKYLKVKSIKNI